MTREKETLKKIKAEINNLDFGFVDEEYKAGISYAVMRFNQIIDKYMEVTMYRVMVVNSNMDDPGSVCRAIDRGDLIPYDSAHHTWDHACKVRDAALKFFPAVIIIWEA